ncbi:hypothetical protein EI77_01831 [Prosthecobacter fusiformis]|uniref:Uncharacterized protein n=1 Tax=Prosthecobacter fusiformis TaxID=48464 RepID=A0A4R7S4S7_9BACT|nr:DUF5713 family protein [Prosthecobacter fusiformis]TDU73361.1 hypothetical protein EI77_01831 [Prosthecobacter fusiformis]
MLSTKSLSAMPVSNPQILAHPFLEKMYSDEYFPPALVDKLKDILMKWCEEIEAVKPADLPALYELSHEATEQINQLAEEFEENESEIETAAREAIAADFRFIAAAYGYEADIEELIAPRDW